VSKPKKFNFVISFIVFACSCTCLAKDPAATCDSKTTNIYFGNGVGVDAGQAMRFNLRALEELVLDSLQTDSYGQELRFLEAYNPTHGKWRDIEETYRQRVLEGKTHPLTTDQLGTLLRFSQSDLEHLSRAVGKLKDKMDLNDSIRNIFLSNDPLELVAEAKAALLESIDSLELDYNLSLTNDKLTQLYKENLTAGQQVLIVAHSQGSLFALTSAETIYDENQELKKSLSVFSIATPADRTPLNRPYVTARDDLIIDTVGIRFKVLPGNIDNDLGFGMADQRDVFNHSFVQSYIAKNLPSRKVISFWTKSFLGSLELPQMVDC